MTDKHRHRGPVVQPPKRNETYYTRRVYVRDGFDCRNGNCPSCSTGKRGDHGISSTYWYFTAIHPEGAITLGVATPYYPETVDPNPTYGYHAAGLNVCLAWPTSRDQIARGDSADSCPYIGRCYPAVDMITRDDTFFDKHFDPAAGKQQTEAFWAAMYQLLLASMDEAAPAKHLHQCAHCQGTGVAASR